MDGHPIFGRILKRPSADQIKFFGEVNEGNVQEHLLFSALIKLVEVIYRVYC